MPPTHSPGSLAKTPGSEPIPGYRLIARIGAGGFGEVWKCEAPGGLHKAIKFVSGEVNVLEDRDSDAEQELRALQHVKSIRHPFLLALDRVEFVENELVIVMELADQSLHDLLEQFRLLGEPGIPRIDLLLYLREAAEVLDLMNLEYGLQHLDIKPRNLFLVRQHVKVADFGLVNSLAELNKQSAAAFQLAAITPFYASPESFLGKITLFSDQYSLAIVYHELLTGVLPFPGKTFRQLALQHTTQDPDLSGLPEGDRPILARALEKDPRKRFPSCMEFVRALISQQATAARPAAETERGPSNPKAATMHDIVLVDHVRTKTISPPTRTVRTDSQRIASAPVVEDETPTLSVDGLQFIDCLGRNPLGELWKVETPEGAPHLLKLVNTLGVPETAVVGRLREFHHPGLVPATIAPHPPSRVAILTDPVGDSLGQLLQVTFQHGRPGLPREKLLPLLLTAAEALDELFRVHRLPHLGLTPRNLLLVGDRVQIADYGLLPLIWIPAGQRMDQLNPRYCAPELLTLQAGASFNAASRAWDSRSDQYSLALIYFELLTGNHLFGTMTQRQLAVARTEGRINLDLVPGPDRDAVARALCPDPNDRHPTCTAFIRTLLGLPPDAIPVATAAVASRQPQAVHPAPGSVAAPAPVAVPTRLLSEVVQPGYDSFLAAVIAQTLGDREVREMGGARFLLRPGEGLEHRCYLRLVPGTFRLKVGGWRDEWRAILVDQHDDDYLFHVHLRSSFLRRCLGKRPALEICLRVLASSAPPPGITDILVQVRPHLCSADEGAHALERYGRRMLESLRTHMQAAPERRAQDRLPYLQTIAVSPVLGQGALGADLSCQTTDISLGGLGLIMPSQPSSSAVVVHLPHPSGEHTAAIPAHVIRAQPCENGRFAVGLQFGDI